MSVLRAVDIESRGLSLKLMNATSDLSLKDLLLPRAGFSKDSQRICQFIREIELTNGMLEVGAGSRARKISVEVAGQVTEDDRHERQGSSCGNGTYCADKHYYDIVCGGVSV
jgi:hypothetical protein